MTTSVKQIRKTFLDYFAKKKNEIVQISNEQWKEIASYWDNKLQEMKKIKGK